MGISVRDRKLLWGRARSQCAYPSCEQSLFHDLADAGTADVVGNPVILGEEAHIRSGRPGGPRYDADYRAELIDRYSNLILLCGTHHTLIDKAGGRGYSVQDLITMKERHESGSGDEPSYTVSKARPVRDWSPQRLGVHPAVPGEPQHRDVEFTLPMYVRRPHDRRLRDLVADAVDGVKPLMVLVRGGSCTGKTRSAYEAIQSVPDSWPLLFPQDASDLVQVVSSGAVTAASVLWLNEAQDYFGGDSGESAAAALLRRLDGPGPLLVVATLWPEYDAALRATPVDVDGADPHRNARALLTQAIRVDTPDSFADCLEDLSVHAANDESLAAVVGLGVTEVTQTLAAGPDLVDYYERPTRPDGPYGAAVISAAMDAHRLGATAPLPLTFLEAAAPAYLNDRERADAPSDWFRRALTYATRTIKGVTAPLQNVPDPAGMGRLPGVVRLADYLQQHGRHTRALRCPPDVFWRAAIAHAATDHDRECLGSAARERGRYEHARRLWESMAEPNVYNLAIMAGQAGDTDGFERYLQLTGVDPMAVRMRRQRAEDAGEDLDILSLLFERDEDAPDALIRAGEDHERAGRRDEAKRCFQRAAELGDCDGMQVYAWMVFEDGEQELARELYERSAQLGDIYAYSRLGHRYLAAGNLVAGEEYLRKAIDHGLIVCYLDLIALHADDSEVRDALIEEAVNAGEVTCPMLTSEVDGDYDAADELALWAVTCGHVEPLRTLVLGRLQRGNAARAALIAERACDAGEAFVVLGMSKDEQDLFGTTVLDEVLHRLTGSAAE